MRREALVLLVVLILLTLLPLALGEHYFIQLMSNFFIFAILTTGLQILIGFSGILSLGHAAFFGIGAYTSAILSVRLNAPFPLALLAGCIVAGGLGLVMSPILRLREVYFAIASFAFGIIAAQVFANWKTMTGGHDGLIMIPFASIGGLTFDTPAKFYFLSLACLVGQYLILATIMRGPFGRALAAMRQNEHAALSVGLNLTKLKVIVVVIAATSAGLAGGLFAHFYGSITPQTFGWQQSVSLLTMVVVGGGRGFAGVLAATFLLLFLPEYFRAMAEYSALINGIILTAIVVILPNGISSLPGAVIGRWPPLFSRRSATTSHPPL